MNNIRDPLLPGINYDSSDISENLSKTSQTEIEKSHEVLSSTESPDGEKKLSDEIVLILIGMGMEKYVKLFQKENILFDTFLLLNEADLQEIGIPDPEDRKTIAKNLSVHKKKTNEFLILENHVEDLRIIQNVSRRLSLLQAYSAYVNLQMMKQNLTDYRINEEETACTYLRSFTESALIQSQILSQAVYDEQNMDALLNKVYKECNIPLPREYYRAFYSKKRKAKPLLKIMAALGFSSLFILTGRFLIRKWLVF